MSAIFKITIQQSEDCAEPEVIVRCREMDDAVMQIVAALRTADRKVVGERNGRSYVLEPGEVFYFESVDKKTFVYTEKEVYETPLKLYELETRLAGTAFFRAGKSLIINLSRVKVFSPSLSGRIEVVLDNKERLFVSRQYVPGLKERLGM